MNLDTEMILDASDEDEASRSLSPQPTPPKIDYLKSNIHSVAYAVVYMNVCFDMKDLIKNIERYHFADEQKKADYCAQIYALIGEGQVIYRKLFQEEMESGNNFFSNINQNWSPLTSKDATPSKKEEAFKTVRGRKKGRSPTPPKDTTTKKAKTFELDISNKFNTLDLPQNMEDESNEDDTPGTNGMEENSQPSGGNFTAARPIPPITIDNIQKSSELLKTLQDLTKQKMRGRVVGKGLRVYPETPEAYDTIRSFINKEKLESSTYQLHDEKELKAVIRGMPSDTPPQDIIDDLYQLCITVNECHAMTNRKTGAVLVA
ncbi:hypothetical protein TNCT_693451 [Trichonephila clavata]|uniref:Uncharacterized protein n=1 Tax=Trichonephila clavata TaxID=2740835 RepID=A0A8X6HD97_TRICU|nr:hypothetical protein TNCT_693451 [Trichonephila clavata]